MLTSYSVKFIRSVICPLEITPRLPVLQAHNLFTSYLSASLSSTLTLSPAALIVCTALSFTPSACPAACHILYSAHLQPGPVICQPTLSNIKAPVHKLQEMLFNFYIVYICVHHVRPHRLSSLIGSMLKALGTDRALYYSTHYTNIPRSNN